ncbi:MAG: SIMPL domain-containing protein [Candidatus Liptonbacteria bacterium]|nr:SIMPL domain-containing protein [Candidatus Liptonbacteria bacterium]
MDRHIKNIFGIAVSIAVLVFAYAALSYAGSFGKSIQPSSFRNFSVTGEAKVVAVPDVAQFTFSVLTEGGTDISVLQKDNTDKVNRAIAFVKAGGVDAKDVQTQSYNLEPRYTTYQCYPRPIIQNGVTTVEPCPPPKITGYSIRQEVLVKIRDFDKIGDLLGGVIKNGANSVSNLNFTIDDPAKYQQDAREKAIAKAKEKAKLVARAGDFGLGRLLGIEEGGYQPYANYKMLSAAPMMEGLGGGAAPAPSIEPGSQEIAVTVTLRYEIQ